MLLPVVVGLIAFRLLAFTNVPEWDIGTYCVVGDELCHGRSLYVDTWDMKPPAIFYSYAAAGVVSPGGASGAVTAMSVIVGVLTLVGVWLVARPQGATAASCAALFYAAVCYEPLTSAHLPNTESFINLFVVLAWALMLRADRSRRGWAMVVLAGISLAWASMYKHVAVAPAAALALGHVLAGDGRRVAIAQAGAMLAMVAIGWAVLFAWFALTGRGEVFWETVFVYPRFYAGGLMHNLARSVTPSAWQLAPVPLLAVLGGVAAFGAAMWWNQADGSSPDRSRRRWIILLLCMIPATHVAVALPGQFAEHYYQFWHPVLAIAAGAGTAGIMERLRSRWLGIGLAVATTAALLAPQVRWLGADASAWSTWRYGRQFDDARRDMLAFAGRLQAKDELYVWGDEPWLYVLAGKRARYAGLWKSHCVEGPVSLTLTARTLAQFATDPPEYIVTWSDPWPAEHPIVRYLSEQYGPVEGAPTYPMRFYRRLEVQHQ